jgi:hypothetical protein
MVFFRNFEGFLSNPIVSDMRTDITAELLSEKGYAVMVEDEEGGESQGTVSLSGRRQFCLYEQRNF